MFIHNHKTVRRVLYLSVLAIAFLTSCREATYRELTRIEQLMETSPAQADTLLSSIPEPQRASQKAWYAVLKTQLDYKLYREIESDSLIKTATEYYGTPYKNVSRLRRYRAAMAWYSQGCVYSELNSEESSIESYLKSLILFPDTTIRYYALAEQNTGKGLLNKGFLNEAQRYFTNAEKNARLLQDSAMNAYADYNIALINLRNEKYEQADTMFSALLSDRWLSPFYHKEIFLQLAKISSFYKHDYQKSLSLLDLCLSDGLDKGAAYNLKALNHMYLNNNDSAFFYFRKSLSCNNDIYTLYSVYSGLAELETKCEMNDSALYYKSLSDTSLDSVYRLRNQERLSSIIILNNEVVKHKKIHSFKIKTIALSISALTIVIVLLWIIKRKKTIEEKRLNESVKDEKAISSLEKEQLLSIFKDCTDKFNNTEGHILVKSISIGDYQLKSDDVMMIRKEVNMHFHPFLVYMSNKYSELTKVEREVCLFSLLGMNSDTYAKTFSKSYSTATSIKSHVKNKLPKEIFEVIFK